VFADNGCYWVLNVGLVAITEVEVVLCDRGQATVLPQLSATELEPLGQLVLDVRSARTDDESVHLAATWRDHRGHPQRVEVDLPADGQGKRPAPRPMSPPAVRTPEPL
jgi:hypothetical protein